MTPIQELQVIARAHAIDADEWILFEQDMVGSDAERVAALFPE